MSDEDLRTVTVSIGRNVGDDEMDIATWGDFANAVEHILDDNGGTIHFGGIGNGGWDDKTEESYTVVASVANDVNVTMELIGRFSVLAEQYGQDAIAVTFGQTVFCTATPDYEALVI